MAGFYTIVALLGMAFIMPGVKLNVVVASVIIGISRVASSKSNKFNFSNSLHIISLHANLGLHSWSSVNSSCLDTNFQCLGNTFWTVSCWFSWKYSYRSFNFDINHPKFCNLAELFPSLDTLYKAKIINPCYKRDIKTH